MAVSYSLHKATLVLNQTIALQIIVMRAGQALT